MTCIPRLSYASTKLITLYLPFCQLAVIGHILTNQVLRCWADGGFEISKKRLQTVFLVSPSSPLGHTTLSRLLLYTANAICVRDDLMLVLLTLREKKWLPADYI